MREFSSYIQLQALRVTLSTPHLKILLFKKKEGKIQENYFLQGANFGFLHILRPVPPS